MRRRTFMHLTGALGLGWTLPGWAAADTGRTLVLLHLKGANDGLNTLIPFDNDDYKKLRPKIAVPKSEAIEMGDSAVGPLGLHQRMAALDASFNNDLAVLPGVGYPSQNRSHFKSVKLWATGSDGIRANRKGWLVDAVERQFAAESIELHGASLDGSLEVFRAGNGRYLSMARLSQLTGLNVPESMEQSNGLLNLVQNRTQTLSETSQALEAKLSRARRLPVRMPHGELSAQLTEVIRLISSGARVPVMHVTLDGFDTHEGQLWRHPRLLEELSQSLAAFRQNLIRLGHWDETLLMTYAEFGRRAGENGSEGTDHGTANTHFVMGGRVRGGLYGEHPRLDRLEDGDMVHSMDYRAIYQTISSHWWGDPLAWAEYSDPRLAGLLRV